MVELIRNLKWILLLISAACVQMAFSQPLRPGFDREEYLELMRISVRTANDTAYSIKYEPPRDFRSHYRSAPMALDNLWDLWTNDNGRAVISMRGTTPNADSWLENVYAVMVPAQGKLKLGKAGAFDNYLAPHPRAAVHAGWLVGMAFLANEIVPKIDSLQSAGINQFIIVGHSQGGALAYLLQLSNSGRLQAGMQLKTYCSAAPKPGNRHFAYGYEASIQAGWAFNMVNAADWVPEVPFSIRTINDFNPTNLLVNASKIIKKQPFAERMAMKHVYKKLDKPTRKAQANYEKYPGAITEKMVVSKIEGLEVPEYAHTDNYVRTGTTIVLTPDGTYYSTFKDDPANIFVHHYHDAYMQLTAMIRG